ncbi:hypothetical protein F0342_03535 [Bacillus sp. CH30_1T]|uniref:hypothetical protein n=1 Tax=Bacillus sp. CH30_1T TaxID=2604836 RepID=UPI0011EBC53D|nr:hypothetical protein [Bacillus sp. CH30_1T]KAA0565775.1 hypothetical protein F0342_03535 [Bacillus sp. CH30_1T]
MIETFLHEWNKRNQEIMANMKKEKISTNHFYELAITQLELLKKVYPQQVKYTSQQAEFYHLDGYLRKAGELYQRVLELDPLVPLSKKEIRLIQTFCPILMITPKECFPLKDIVAIHHPSKPLMGYHLFWEDDYDFPDDYEPCDHEEIWIEYHPVTEVVTNVMCWFHSRVLSSEAAVKEAQNHQQRAIIRIEWGKHGSLLCGWEKMKEPLTGILLSDWLKESYQLVKSGGRLPDHPLKRYWPKGFEGDLDDYTDYSVKVDLLDYLIEKPLMFKTKWVNAVIFTHSLHYNFHPKMEWPERFVHSLE